MSLFKRSSEEAEERRCPACRERVPESAQECAMCGHRLEDVAASSSAQGAKTQSSG